MTDKQIIIDGVDVSGCLFYQTNFEEDYDIKIKHYCSNWHNSCESNNNSNCYYKQLQREKQNSQEAIDISIKEFNRAEELKTLLKRKEQECNKLYIQLKADEEYHKEEENTLRKIIKNKEERNIELYKENNKLKQTLTEVKEIAEENIRIAELEGLNGVYRRGLAEHIIQKISECEVENDR